MNRAGTRSRRPQGVFDDSAFGTVALPSLDTDGDGVVDQQVLRITPVAAVDLDDTLQSTTAGENGYGTQNQRYLHVFGQTSDSFGNQGFNVWGYNYAHNRWGLYNCVDGDDNGSGDLGFNSLWRFSARAPGTPHNFHFIIPIQGVDRVAIVIGLGGWDASTSMHLAVSTF
jgi:hypothetical protein